MGTILTCIYSALGWTYIILFFVLVPVFAFPFSLIFGLKRSFRLFFRAFIKFGFIIFGCRPVVSGLENIPRGKNAILVANHTSFLDPFILNAGLPRFFNFIVFARVLNNFYTYVTLKFCGIAIRHYGHVLSGSSAIIRVVKAINGGDPFILFPSEMVIPDGTIDKIRPGLYKIIQDTDAVILPVHISGGIRFKFLQTPPRPKIVIGKPIEKLHILSGRDAFIKQAISELQAYG